MHQYITPLATCAQYCDASQVRNCTFLRFHTPEISAALKSLIEETRGAKFQSTPELQVELVKQELYFKDQFEKEFS